jgi:hypothetical protein
MSRIDDLVQADAANTPLALELLRTFDPTTVEVFELAGELFETFIGCYARRSILGPITSWMRWYATSGNFRIQLYRHTPPSTCDTPGGCTRRWSYRSSDRIFSIVTMASLIRLQAAASSGVAFFSR